MSDPGAPPTVIELTVPEQVPATALVHAPPLETHPTHPPPVVGQKRTEVSEIIANVNSELGRQASALSKTLAAMDTAAAIAQHNSSVEAMKVSGHKQEAVTHHVTTPNPDTPPEKETKETDDEIVGIRVSENGSEDGKKAIKRRGLPDDVIHNTTSTTFQQIRNRTANDASTSAAAYEQLPTTVSGRGMRQKKRRLMPDGSLALEPWEIAEKAKNTTVVVALNPKNPKPKAKVVPKAPQIRTEKRVVTPIPVSTQMGPAITFSKQHAENITEPPVLAFDRIPTEGDFQNALTYFLTLQNNGRPPKTPIFNKAPVDLYVIFREVQTHGGYDAVCLHKKWKKVAGALGRDLTTATSAGHSMRNIYEKFLLDFGNTFLSLKQGLKQGVEEEAVRERAERSLQKTKSNSVPGGETNYSGDSNEDVDNDATLEKLRLALRFQKADLERRLQEQERSDFFSSRNTGRKDDSFHGAWISFEAENPLFDSSRAYFARELPDLELKKPRWAECRLCRGWRDLGDPNGNARKAKTVQRQLPRSERTRARMELDGKRSVNHSGANIMLNDKRGYRPGARLGPAGAAANFPGFVHAEEWVFRKATTEDLKDAARLAATEQPSVPIDGQGGSQLPGSPNAVDALAAAATAIVTETAIKTHARKPSKFRDTTGTLEAMASAAMNTGVPEEDRSMFATEEAKKGMHDAFHAVVTAVVNAFAETRVPIEETEEGVKAVEKDDSTVQAKESAKVSDEETIPLDVTPVKTPTDEKVDVAAEADAETQRVMASLNPQRVAVVKTNVNVVSSSDAIEPPVPIESELGDEEYKPDERVLKPTQAEVSELLKKKEDAALEQARKANELEKQALANGASDEERRLIQLEPVVKKQPEPVVSTDPPNLQNRRNAQKPTLKFVIKKPVSFSLGKKQNSPVVTVDDAETKDASEPTSRFQEPKLEISVPAATNHGDPACPEELCACVPRVPEGWQRWEALRKKPNPNGTWAADCYYRTPAGPEGKWKTFILRSEEEICQFLKADSVQFDSVFNGLTMDFFNCKPFTRKMVNTARVVGADPFQPGGAVTHKWRAEMVAPMEVGDQKINDKNEPETTVVPVPQPRVTAKTTHDESSSDDEIEEDVAPTDSDDENIADVVEGPLWYD